MPVQPQRTPVATLRRDLNSEYVALARHVHDELMSAREVIAYLLDEQKRMRVREWIWAGGLIVLAVCVALLAS